MKKVLFAAVTLDVGGIETALVTLLNYLAKEKKENNYEYDITLVLERKHGIFLDMLDKRIHILEYKPSANKNIVIRKFLNFIKQVNFKRKYGKKFDFSASYATYSLPASFVAREASNNSALWCHMDYLSQFGGSKEKVKSFFVEKHYTKFKRLIFVSEKSKQSFLKVFPDMEDKTYFINNLINAESIREKSQETPDEVINKENSTIFINIGRHDENQKRLSRIIEACSILKKEKLDYKVLFIGDGQDSDKYKKMVKEFGLEDTIYFLGRKKNPYPYLKMADCMILTSDYEGSPVVFTEAMVLGIPIITTAVAGSEQIDENFGVIVKEDINDIAEKMQQIIIAKYPTHGKFDSRKYNDEIVKKIEEMIISKL